MIGSKATSCHRFEFSAKIFCSDIRFFLKVASGMKKTLSWYNIRIQLTESLEPVRSSVTGIKEPISTAKNKASFEFSENERCNGVGPMTKLRILVTGATNKVICIQLPKEFQRLNPFYFSVPSGNAEKLSAAPPTIARNTIPIKVADNTKCFAGSSAAPTSTSLINAAPN